MPMILPDGTGQRGSTWGTKRQVGRGRGYKRSDRSLGNAGYQHPQQSDMRDFNEVPMAVTMMARMGRGRQMIGVSCRRRARECGSDYPDMTVAIVRRQLFGGGR